MDVVGFVVGQLFFLTVFGAPFALLVLGPLGWVAHRSGPSVRRAGALLLAYALTAAFLGWHAYSFVPAQYTRDGAFLSAPKSNSLGEIHAVFLERAGIPEAISPDRAPAIRAMVAEERATFIRRWLTLAAIGLIACAVLLIAPAVTASRPSVQ